MKTVSIIIPVYNEEATIKRIISRVKKANTLGLKKEIIIVDDASTDKSSRIIRSLKDKYIRKFTNKTNSGKGYSIRKGFKEATGDIIIIQDSDLEYDPSEYKDLIRPIIDDNADVVYGSRFISSKPHRVLYFWHSVGNKILTLFSNALTNLNLTDMETCYKVFKKQVIKEILPKLSSNRFGFEPEVTAFVAKLAKKNRCNIYEVGISYHGRTYSQGKKINWKDGFKAFWYILKYNLTKSL